jgi:hypothetical protein
MSNGTYPNLEVDGRKTTSNGSLKGACPQIGVEGSDARWDPVRGPPHVICPYEMDAFGNSLPAVRRYAQIFGTTDQGYNTALMPQWCTQLSTAQGACPNDPTTGKPREYCLRASDGTDSGSYCRDWAETNPDEMAIALRQYCAIDQVDLPECECLPKKGGTSAGVVTCIDGYARTGVIKQNGVPIPVTPIKGKTGSSHAVLILVVIIGIIALAVLAFFGYRSWMRKREARAAAMSAAMAAGTPTPGVAPWGAAYGGSGRIPEATVPV